MTLTARFLCFAAGGALLLWALHSVSVHLDPPYRLERERWNALFERADSLTTLAAGNSHCLAVDFEALGVAGFHVWQVGNDVFEMAHQLEAVLPRLPAVDTVLLCLSWATFHRDNAACRLEDFSELRRALHATLPGWRPIAGDWRALLQGKLSAVVRRDHWRGVFDALGVPPALRQSRFSLDGWGRPLREEMPSAESWDALRRRALEHKVPRQVRLQRDVLANDPSVPERAQAALVSTLRQIRERGVRVVLFTPPYFREYRRAYPSALREEMERRIREVAADQGLSHHDFASEPRFDADHRLFFDADHLSRKGARLFSSEFLSPVLGDGDV